MQSGTRSAGGGTKIASTAVVSIGSLGVSAQTSVNSEERCTGQQDVSCAPDLQLVVAAWRDGWDAALAALRGESGNTTGPVAHDAVQAVELGGFASTRRV